MLFQFDNSYARDLEGFYVLTQGEEVPAPEIVELNGALARELGVDEDELAGPAAAAILTGSQLAEGSEPLAQAYAGHQFGGFSPQLGDGRAILLGEVIDTNGERRDIHLKGSGRTAFSRGGDGKAVLGPVLREYLFGESMYALGIPTTRALAAVRTGQQIEREGPKPGAVLARVASSHLRVGTFQFFAARGETEKLRQLADYSIDRHFPDIKDSDTPYLDFLRAVMHAQASLIAKWMHVGFIHGVMNTDNTTISGETIDYGPCAFMDSYDPNTVFSSIDRRGRYAYGNQPLIARWNLARLAETLIPLMGEDTDASIAVATEIVEGFSDTYLGFWLDGLRSKIGLSTSEEEDQELVHELFVSMVDQDVDFTLFFRRLAEAARGDAAPVRELFKDPDAPTDWLHAWETRCSRESTTPEDRAATMNRTNPVYVPRNHKVEEALTAAVEQNDLSLFRKLLTILADPYVDRSEFATYALPAPPEFGPYQTFCGT